MTYKLISLPPEDSQFLETRKFSVDEICRIFRVTPHLVQDMEHATFSNIEHQSMVGLMSKRKNILREPLPQNHILPQSEEIEALRAQIQNLQFEVDVVHFFIDIHRWT